jgi:hypothetical protein
MIAIYNYTFFCVIALVTEKKSRLKNKNTHTYSESNDCLIVGQQYVAIMREQDSCSSSQRILKLTCYATVVIVVKEY